MQTGAYTTGQITALGLRAGDISLRRKCVPDLTGQVNALYIELRAFPGRGLRIVGGI